ncbi:MAG: hypothetical protein IJS96_02080 [Schwartzia sp.]|nr:hypothetical protein [Schwartzia sp. (in: firmicutes)]
MKHMGYLVALLAALLLALGCASGMGKMRELQGHWVDVNSQTTLDISGDRLTVTTGRWSETCRFKVKNEDDITYLVNAEKGASDFGFMTNLRVGDDGSLEASDMVLDGRSHQYRFVRPEMLAGELEIQDLSQDAPKTIQSGEIKDFSLTFENNGVSYGLTPDWPIGYYSWEIKRRDGRYRMRFRVMGDSYVVMDFDDEVSDEYVAGLAQLLVEKDIIQYNGYYRKNNVHRYGYSLSVTYASREHLRVRADGDAAAACVFDLASLLDYAARQPLPEGI